MLSVKKMLLKTGPNSVMVILPKVLIESLGLSVGDEVEISVDGNALKITAMARVPILEVRKKHG